MIEGKEAVKIRDEIIVVHLIISIRSHKDVCHPGQLTLPDAEGAKALAEAAKATVQAAESFMVTLF